jgi:hypothetical protein
MVEQFSHPVVLVLISNKITDAGLDVVSRFKNLRGLALYLSDAPITDAGIARLRALDGLETLSLESSKLTEQCVLEIGRFPRLRQITLSEVPVTLKGLKAIGQMKALTTLDLRAAALSDEAFKALDVLKNTHPDWDIMDPL